MKALGWAIVMNGEIDIRSVSRSREGAIVNWLCTEMRYVTSGAMSPGEIERVFCTLRGFNGMPDAEVIQVTIRRSSPPAVDDPEGQ